MAINSDLHHITRVNFRQFVLPTRHGEPGQTIPLHCCIR